MAPLAPDAAPPAPEKRPQLGAAISHVITPRRAAKQALYASFSAAAASAARLVRTPIMRLFMRSRRRVPYALSACGQRGTGGEGREGT